MQNFIESIISALSSGNVDFIVVGGVSAVLQGAISPSVIRRSIFTHRRHGNS